MGAHIQADVLLLFLQPHRVFFFFLTHHIFTSSGGQYGNCYKAFWQLFVFFYASFTHLCLISAWNIWNNTFIFVDNSDFTDFIAFTLKQHDNLIKHSALLTWKLWFLIFWACDSLKIASAGFLCHFPDDNELFYIPPNKSYRKSLKKYTKVLKRRCLLKDFCLSRLISQPFRFTYLWHFGGTKHLSWEPLN